MYYITFFTRQKLCELEQINWPSLTAYNSLDRLRVKRAVSSEQRHLLAAGRTNKCVRWWNTDQSLGSGSHDSKHGVVESLRGGWSIYRRQKIGISLRVGCRKRRVCEQWRRGRYSCVWPRQERDSVGSMASIWRRRGGPGEKRKRAVGVCVSVVQKLTSTS